MIKEIRQIIGYDDTAPGKEIFFSDKAIYQAGEAVKIFKATVKDVELAAEKAVEAFQSYRKKNGVEKAGFLEAIATEIEKNSDELISVCMKETNLPKARLEGERTRTVQQLRIFAALLKEGSWTDARIDHAMPDRMPLPRPDLRSMLIPLGPVAVFGASNFPLAFSVAGGDTASALAAGCPVIVKAHPAHPVTSFIAGRAIREAARSTGMPDGVFSLLFDDGIETGMQLVRHKLIKAVGFTGSFKAGKAIYDAAVRREEPIPVYAEMGSSNPVFILPKAAKERGNKIAEAYAASVTLGVGQFCTNPGLLIYQKPNEDFIYSLQQSFEKTAGGVMLTSSISGAYQHHLQERSLVAGVEKLAAGSSAVVNGENTDIPVLFSTSADVFRNNSSLAEEIFGPSGTVVATDTRDELIAIAKELQGQITVTVHGEEDELPDYRDLLDILEQKAGRIVINGFPTGVEVCNAMVHGGPFPATTDSKTTSVGTAAIYRFVRPVCYQNMPQSLLPPELKDDNPLSIARISDNVRTGTHSKIQI
ncbi:MAG: aldehyde dehydrogenase (NADP(+)) [Citrobacter freundii]|nr:MAG: aldehyde dehydrogenase (NADP(+)) [Citrobacter freundii]